MKKRWLIKYQNFILTIGTSVLILFMTIGFATYSKITNMTGKITLQPDGYFQITKMEYSDSSNLDRDNSSMPIITGNSISFNLVYKKEGDNPEYYAEYTVQVENNTSYDYTFNDFNFVPYVNGSNGGTGVLELSLSGIESGDIISAKTSITFKIKLVLTVDDDTQSYDAGGTTELETETKELGSLLVAVDTKQVNLTGSNSRKQVTYEVMNTYDESITFTPTVNNNAFKLTTATGGAVSSTSIAAGETKTFTTYISRNGDPHFYSDSVNLRLSLKTEDKGNYLSNEFEALVDIYVEPDTEPPTINDFYITKNNTEGRIDVSFIGTDNSNGDITYTIQLFNASTNKQVGSTITYTSSSSSTINRSFTGISQSTNTVNYYAKIYGKDSSGNTSSTITSDTISVRWRASITYNLQDAKSSNTSSSVLLGSSYASTLSYSGSGTGSISDDNVTVTMGGKDITSTAYTSSTDKISITQVTDDIVITGGGTSSGTGGGDGPCLAKGTKILMADGSEKNIEDISYDDLIAAYNYDIGKIVKVYPLWIEEEHESPEYQRNYFSDGTYLDTVGPHGIFSKDANKYVSANDDKEFHVGTRIIKFDNYGNKQIVTVTKIEKVNKNVKYYHVSSTGYTNVIANNVLTSDIAMVFANLYKFDDNLVWKEDRNIFLSQNDLFTNEQLAVYFEEYIYRGFRAWECKHIYNMGVLDLQFYSDLLKYLVKEPIKNNDGINLWKVTTSDMTIDSLYEQESEIILPAPINKNNFIGWYNTSEDKYYMPGDKVTVWYGMYFEAKYK